MEAGGGGIRGRMSRVVRLEEWRVYTGNIKSHPRVSKDRFTKNEEI